MTKTVLLGDLIEIKHGFAFKGKYFSDIKTKNVLVTPGNFSIGGGFKQYKLKYYDGPIDNNYILKPDSIIVTMTDLSKGMDTLGFSARVPIETNKIYLHNQRIGLVSLKDCNNVDVNYLYWLMRSDNYRRWVVSSSTGSTVKHTAPSKILSYRFLLPDLETQKQIASILSSLDEKIELNRKMNETLEQIGQALFRHYFIDNPEAEGWKKRELGEFFPIKTGKKDANYGSVDGDYLFFTCSQSISKAPDYSFDGHALLLAGNGEFNLKLYRGKFEAYQRTYVLIPRDEGLLGILYFLMKLKLPEITGGSRGSVIKFITKGMIENYKFSLPNNAELKKMSIIFNQITINIEENIKEIRTLTSIRDSLLPRLINGVVKI